MTGLLSDTRPQELSDGLQGAQRAARAAKAASDGELDADYRAGMRLLEDFEEDAVVDVTGGGVSFARGSVRLFEGIYTMATTEDPGIDEFVDAIKSYGDAILQFADAVISFLFDFSDTIAGAFFLDLMGDNSRRGIKGIREGNNPF